MDPQKSEDTYYDIYFHHIIIFIYIILLLYFICISIYLLHVHFL